MMTHEEAVKARIAALKIERLYNAYRATSRANGMVLTRLASELEKNEKDRARRQRIGQRIIREMAVSRESDFVFKERAEQIRRRLEELDGFEAL